MTLYIVARFYIPRAGEATKAVKMAIIRLSDDTLGQPCDYPGKTRRDGETGDAAEETAGKTGGDAEMGEQSQSAAEVGEA